MPGRRGRPRKTKVVEAPDKSVNVDIEPTVTEVVQSATVSKQSATLATPASSEPNDISYDFVQQHGVEFLCEACRKQKSVDLQGNFQCNAAKKFPKCPRNTSK